MPHKDHAVPYCVVPAGGASSRMQDWKPGLSWGKTTIIEKVVANAKNAGCRVIVVGGYRDSELRRLFTNDEQVILVYNPEWESGMLGSVRLGLRTAAGLASLAGDSTVAPGCLVTPADMPLIAVQTYRLLLARVQNHPKLPGSLFPCHGGQPGHPVWINLNLLPIIEALPADGRLKAYLMRYSYELVPCDDPGISIDLDTPEEYRRYSNPGGEESSARAT